MESSFFVFLLGSEKGNWGFFFLKKNILVVYRKEKFGLGLLWLEGEKEEELEGEEGWRKGEEEEKV